MPREANCFLAGAAWNALGCYVCCPLAAGRHQWAALVARIGGRPVALRWGQDEPDRSGMTRFSVPVAWPEEQE